MLPTWPGADRYYTDALAILKTVNAKDYTQQRRADPRKSFRYTPSFACTRLTEALNRGDEETIKHAVQQYHALGYLPMEGVK